MASTYAQVGDILTRVRQEFSLASSSGPDNPEGSTRAAGALQLAFELLNSSSLCVRSVDGTTGQDCAANEPSLHQEEQQHQKQKRRRRSAFLESAFLPFASFLLREVGPKWLPLWDRIIVADDIGNLSTNHSGGDNNNSSSPIEERTSKYHARAARRTFDSFFRPPFVPASLALLALCEALGKQPNTLTSWSSSITTVGLSGGDSVAVAGGVAPRPQDARIVQHACRLLEPYLDGISPLLSEMRPPAHEASSCADIALLAAGENGVTTSNVATGGEASADKPTAAAPKKLRVGDETKEARHLFVQAVLELTSSGGAGSTGDDLEEEREPWPGGGGDMAERLAAALCLAPQRVANALGPVASPTFAPDTFFPTVCRAVVCSILVSVEHPVSTGTAERRDEEGGVAAERVALVGAACAAHTVIDAARSKHLSKGGGEREKVWRAFSDRLLMAGRSSDLADACLRAIAAEGKRFVVSTAAAWEAWADSPDSPHRYYAWMVSAIPPSRRKSFTEALLRALWPRQRRRGSQPTRGHHQQGYRQIAVANGDDWPPGFLSAACRALIGRTLIPPSLILRDAGVAANGEAAGKIKEEEEEGQEEEFSENGEVDLSIALVEDLVLRRPLPPQAAEAIADTLAWCDRQAAVEAGGIRGSGGRGRSKVRGRKQLVMGTLKRVAAVWAEPSFVNTSPSRQQDFYSRFLLAALRR